MAKAIASQASFIAGELDPRLAARIDTESYTKGAQTLTNVLCLGQGGVKRRPGMRYVDTLTDTSIRLVSFEFNVEQTYLLVFAELKMYIYKDGIKQTDINATGLDYLVTPYTAVQAKELGWTQSADTLILCHNLHEPRKIVRGSTDVIWTLSTIDFAHLPTHDFNKDYDTGIFKPDSADYKVGDTAKVNIRGVCSDDTKITEATCVSPATWDGSGENPLTAEHVGGMFTGNGGVIRIEKVDITAGAQYLEGHLLQEFINGNDIDGLECNLEEPVWTAEYGYPGTATFHEARLWMSNTTKRPQTLWGSQSGDFFNFDRGYGDDADAIDVTLDTDQVNAVYHLVSGRHLQIFTSGGEFFIPDRPIKPSSVGVLRQTKFGMLKDVPPINVDGATMFIQRNGKQVREYLYTYTENSYVSTEVNLLAPHLINSPVAMDSQTGDVDNEGNYLFIVNGDGTIAVFITNRAESVTAWTRFTTDGEVKDVSVVEDVVYFYVKRNINGSDVYHIEALDNKTFTDASVRVTNDPATDTITGLDHLNGEECRVRADSSVMDNATPTGGSITIERDAVEVEVGINFDIEIKTMPVNLAFSSGPINATKRRILRVSAHLYESNGVRINDKPLTDKGFGSNVLDSTPSGFTGIRTVPMLGYSKTSQVTVTQSDPAPMTLLGLTLEIQSQGG